MQVADILAEVAAPHVNPSIQSPPLGFKPKVTGPEYVNEFTRHVINTVAHMVQLEKRTGRTVTLCARARARVLPRDDRGSRRLLHEPPLRERSRSHARARPPA